MKKILVCLLMVGLSTGTYAQKPANIRPAALGISFLFNDFATAQRVRSTSLTTVLNNRQFAKLREAAPGIGVTYFKGLTSFIDFAGTLGGSFPKVTQQDGTNSSGDQFLLEADASVNIKMFPEQFYFTPYVSAGVGVSSFARKFDAILPLGVGFKLNILDEAAIYLNGQYRVPVTSQTNTYHFQYGIGFAGVIGKRKAAPVE